MASRVMVITMDHLAQGRSMLGIGADGLPGDWRPYDVDGMNLEHRRMTAEVLDIMLKRWESDGGLDYEWQYWTVHVPEPNPPAIRHHLKPFQEPHPPIGVAGFSPGSSAFKLTGERGFYPLSLGLTTTHIAGRRSVVGDQPRRAARVR